MIRIAVCDDDINVCNEISKWLLEYDMKFEIDIKCDIYTSCGELFDKMAAITEYHLIFLDIEFPEMNGIELGNKIRNILKNIKTEIIFISAKQDYAMELFDIQPFNFLVKTFEKQKFITCISKFISYYNSTYKFFTYTYENTKHKIAISEIIYFKSSGKKMIMHTEHNDIIYYGDMSKIENQGLEQRFITVKRGMMVNIQHIIHSSFEKLKLSDGSELGISRSYRNRVRERLSFF